MPRQDKRPKDTNAPKRPQSAYFLFANNRRAELKKQGNDKKITEVSKIISAEWKQLDTNAKKKWDDEAKIVKEKYLGDVEQYQKTPSYKKYCDEIKKWKQHKKNNSDNDDDNEEDDDEDNSDDNSKKKTKKPKKPKDENAPKRPPSGYFLFQNDRREQIRKQDGSKKMKEITQVIGQEWSNMSQDEKKPYEERATEKKLQYQKDVETYKKSDNFKLYQKALDEWKADCKQTKSGKSKKKVVKKSTKQQKSDDSDEDDQNSGESENEDEDMNEKETNNAKSKNKNTSENENDNENDNDNENENDNDNDNDNDNENENDNDNDDNEGSDSGNED